MNLRKIFDKNQQPKSSSKITKKTIQIIEYKKKTTTTALNFSLLQIFLNINFIFFYKIKLQTFFFENFFFSFLISVLFHSFFFI